MLGNQDFQGDLANQSILEGTPVYDVNGDKVGEVSDRGLQRNALMVHKGLIFPKELYVPLNAIRGRDANGVYLNVAKGDINSQNWDQPPTETTATTGMAANRMSDTANTATAGTAANDVAIPVREEHLVADKQSQQIGDVRVHRGVTQERETIQAPVSHEEVYVERRAGDNSMPVGDDAFTEKDVDIPVMGEQLNVAKEGHVAGEVHLRKERVTEQQRASDTVRREHVHLDGRPDGVVQGDVPLDDDNTTNYGAGDTADTRDDTGLRP